MGWGAGWSSLCSFPPCGVGWGFVPRRPAGLAGFVGPRTLKRRVAALGRGVAREHDGYMAGAFCPCGGIG